MKICGIRPRGCHTRKLPVAVVQLCNFVVGAEDVSCLLCGADKKHTSLRKLAAGCLQPIGPCPLILNTLCSG